MLSSRSSVSMPLRTDGTAWPRKRGHGTRHWSLIFQCGPFAVRPLQDGIEQRTKCDGQVVPDTDTSGSEVVSDCDSNRVHDDLLISPFHVRVG